MKKKILTICFIAIMGFIPPAKAEMVDIPDGKSMREYLTERLKKAIVAKLDDKDLKKSSSMDVQHSAEYIASQKESQKSTFQKIYESAIDRVTSQNQPERTDIRNENTTVNRQQQAEWEKPNFDVIEIELPPNFEKTLAPALEHIPYFFSDIELTPQGMMNITETIVVVANGVKLKNGLSRAIPKYSTSRIGQRNKIDMTLISVELDGQYIPYRLQETSNDIMIVPAKEYRLPNGVHTYTIRYLVDHKMWYYDKFNEIYWDATGSSWNLVIARAGALVTLPAGAEPLGYSFVLGYPEYLTEAGATIYKADEGSTGFISRRPLFIGEGMHIIASLPPNVFELPSMGRRFSWFINDFGDVLFSIFGFMAILISYSISWSGMNRTNKKQKGNLRKNPVMLRYLLKNGFDKISFGAFLLELFKRNIIDIVKDDGGISLIKKNDNLTGLESREKKAVNSLFINHESVLKIEAKNALKIKRAYKLLEENTIGKFKNFSLKLNIGYLGFSIGMLLIAEVVIAMLKIDRLQAISVLLSGTASITFYIWFWGKKSNIILRSFIVIFLLFTIFIMSVFVHPMTALLIAAMVYTIFSYTKLFAKRSGLVKGNIIEAGEFEEFLIRNKENILLGKDFNHQQPSIFALDLADNFPKNANIEKVYRLDVVKDLVNKL